MDSRLDIGPLFPATLRTDRFGPLMLAGAFVAAVALSIVGIEAWRTSTARNVQMIASETASTNLARSLAQHASDAFVQADAVLLALVEQLEADGTGDARIAQIQHLLAKEVAALPQLGRLSVLDANGYYLATDLVGQVSHVDHADREYFQFHRTHKDVGPHVGPPIRTRSSNAWVVTVSRRYDLPDGTFGGVVLASIDLDFFNRYYGRFDIGQHGTIVLSMSDGTVIDRRPFRDQLVGSNLSKTPLFREHIANRTEGTARIVSSIDGVERLTSFKRLEDFPLYVVVAFANDDVLNDWVADSMVHALGALVLIVALGLIGTRLIAQIRERHGVELQLLESQRRLRALNTTLEGMAREDGMTGLSNRREFDRVIADAVKRIERNGDPLALVIVDVDHFKAFNDTYGHLAGDDCLRRISATIKACVTRPTDLVARYGGEEFVILMPSTEADAAVAVAEKVRGAVNALAVPHRGCPRGVVTVSLGVGTLKVGEPGATAHALLSRADRALYAAKEGGRDAVQIHELRLVA